MYKINPLMRNVLITTDEVIFHAPTKHTLDPRTIQQSIIVAEERIMRNALCFDFYESLIDEKNKEVTADNKADLENTINNAQPPGTPPVSLAIGDIVNAMEFLSPANKKLWQMYLWKTTAEVVMMLATPEAFVQFGAQGVIHTVPASSPMQTTGEVSPELRSVKWIMDKKLMDRIDPLTEAMHVWLCKNKDSYPLYCKECDCDSNGVAYKRKSDIIVGIYDDDHKNSCGCYD